MTGPAPGAQGPERAVVLDMARLGLYLGPVFIAIATIFWGPTGLASSLFAFALVSANLALGAYIIERAAAISLNALMGAVLGGFVLRLIVLTAVVLPVRRFSWFDVAPFAITLVGGHLALLSWESHRVSTTLTSPNPASRPTPFIPARTRSETE